MRADDLRAAVINQISKVVRSQSEINGDQHGANLRHRIKRFELRVRIRRDVSHAISLPDTELQQTRGPAIAAIQKLLVRQPQSAINHRFAIAVELASAASKVQRSKRRFHGCGTNFSL